jgi:tetratricopeptide (TPR) repeat protein
MRRLEVRAADALLQRACELAGDDAIAAELWLQRGHVLFACGQADAARDAFARSVDLSAHLDSAHRSRALSGRATMTFWTYDMSAADRDARAALRAAHDAGSPAVIAEAEAALALVRSAQGRPGAAIRLADSARELSARSGLDGLSAMAGMVGVLVHHHAGHSAHAATLVDGVAGDCRRAGLPVPLVWALYKGGLARAGIGDFDGALRCWDELEVVAHKTDNASFLAETANCRGHVARELGAFGRADELDHDCLSVAPQLGAQEACANATLNLAASALARGDLDAASRYVDAAMPYLSAREFYRWRYTQRFRYYRARLLLAAGDVDAAQALAEESLQLGRRAGTGKNTLRPLLLLADIRAREDPRGAADDFRRIARRAATLRLDPIAWRAYAAAAEVAPDDTTASTRSRAGAVAVLHRIEQRVPDSLRDSFRHAVAAPVEEGRRDAWRLPL